MSLLDRRGGSQRRGDTRLARHSGTANVLPAINGRADEFVLN
jgi:hypothetical protein